MVHGNKALSRAGVTHAVPSSKKLIIFLLCRWAKTIKLQGPITNFIKKKMIKATSHILPPSHITCLFEFLFVNV